FQNTMSAVDGENMKKDERVKEEKDDSPWNDDKSQSDLVRHMDQLNRREDSTVPSEKNVKELTKNVDEDEEKVRQDLGNMDWACCPKVKILLLKKHVAIGELREELLRKQIAVEKSVSFPVVERIGHKKCENVVMGDNIEAAANTVDDEFTVVRVVGKDLHEVHFRVRQEKCSCGKIKREYAVRVGVAVASLRFFFMGREINDEDTPKKLGMKTDDYIDVYKA
ncbi:hypothetical protein PMAYCL1PPCAC_10358, partial [Pristionchus mayeri]